LSKDKEKTLKSSITMLNGFATGYRRYFVAAILASFGSIVFDFTMPQVVRFTVDYIVGEQPVSEAGFIASGLLDMIGGRGYLRANFVFCALGIVICALCSGISGYIARMSIATGVGGFTKKLRDTLFTHIQRLPYRWHTENQTGDIIQRCTSDVETVQNFVSSQLLDVLRTTILLSTALFLMFSMNLHLALVSAAFIPVIMFYSILFFGKISKQFLECDESEGRLMAGIQENLTAVRVVRAFGRERHERQRFHVLLNDYTDKWVDLGYTLGFYWGAGDMATASQILAVVCVGAWLAATSRATYGEMLAFIIYNQMIAWPVRTLGRTVSELSKAGVSIGRLREILDSPVEEAKPSDLKPDLYDDITFEHVCFSYADTPILKDISFTIPKGATFGILGATGSGKSTIAYLINRLYELPEGMGSIKIGGADIRDIDRTHLRRGVSLVLQEPFLFSKTVRENIAIAAKEDSLERIRECAAIAAVDDNILEFKDGYDTLIGERGVTVSGGQRQRIAISRALMVGSPVIIFDDSTSSVDMETDEKIRKALRENTKGQTVIIISHRVSSLMRADRIMVMENGEIAQLGTHQELISREGIYQRVYRMQSDVRLLRSDSALLSSDSALLSSDSALLSSDSALPHSDSALLSSDSALLRSDSALLSSDSALPRGDSAHLSSDSALSSSDSALMSGEEG